MKSMILGLLAETSIHPGAGHSAGFRHAGRCFVAGLLFGEA